MHKNKLLLVFTSLGLLAGVLTFPKIVKDTRTPLEKFADGQIDDDHFRDPIYDEPGVKPVKMQLMDYTDYIQQPSGASYNMQRDYNLDVLNIGDVWNTNRGDGVTIAVLDTGINYSHNDFVYYGTTGTSISPLSASFEDPTGSGTATIKTVATYGWSAIADENGHGTNVASTVASRINGGSGSVGIAPNVNLLFCRCPNLMSSEFVAAMKYAADNGADIITMSVGMYSSGFPSPYTQKTVAYSSNAATLFTSGITHASNKGCILLASAGNDNCSNKSYPASNTNVIGVGALAKNSRTARADYSNTCAQENTESDAGTVNVDVTCCGSVYVATHSSNSGHGSTQGTSFSCPTVAAALALYKQSHPSATAAQMKEALFNSCEDIGAKGWDPVFGYGCLDIEALVDNDDRVSGFSVTSDKELTLNKGETSQITSSITPSNATNKTVIYEVTSGNDVVSVSNTGLITALDAGSAAIKVYAEEKPCFYETISVDVIGTAETYHVDFIPAYSSTGTSGYSGTKCTYTQDGFAVNANGFNNNNNSTVDAWNCIKAGTSSAYVATIQTNAAITKSISTVRVNFRTVNVNVLNSAMIYVSLSETYSSGTSYTFTPTTGVNSITISSPTPNSYYTLALDLKTSGSNGPFALEYIEFSTSGEEPTPSTKVLESISVSGQKTSFTVGETWSFGTNGKVTAYYEDESTADVTSKAEFSNEPLTSTGSKEVTVSYTEGAITKTTSYNVSVKTSGGGGGDSDYYAQADTSSRQNLASTLHTIISTGTNDVGYNGLFDAYKTTDVKPGTNYFWDMYSNVNYTTNDSRINKNYDAEGDSINREHTIPQSWFNEASPMKSDLFHVYPTDGYVNNRRSNYPHADVDNASWTSNNGSKLGTTNNTAVNNALGSDKKVFEVIDDYKGDFARTYFYFAIRYSNKISSFTTDGKRLFDTNFPYMKSAFIDVYYQWHLQDEVSQKEIDRNNAVYGIQKNRNPFIDHPEWADYIFKGIDLPTEEKVLTSIEVSTNTHRSFAFGADFVKETITANYSDNSQADVTNSAIFTGYDKNTAGEQTITVSYIEDEVTKETSYKVIVADPVVKSFNLSYNSSTLTSMSLDKYSNPDESILASITADTGADTSIEWSYNPTGIVEVTGSGTNYTVTAISVGTTTVTATCGDIDRSFTVSVADSTPTLVSSISISGPNTVQEGSSITLSASVLPNNADNKGVTWSASPSGVFELTANDSNGTVSVKAIGSPEDSATITAAAKDGSGVSDTFEITITEAVTVNSISIEYSGVDGEHKVSFARYPSGTDLDAKVIAHLSNGDSEDVTESATKNFKVNYLKLGHQQITASYGGLSQVSLDIFVTNKGSSEYVGVSTKATRAAGSFNATPAMQAEAWADYFIRQTGGGSYSGPCKLDKDLRAGALQGVWKDIENEYVWMADASKDVFVDNSGNNSLIADAQEHYRHICKTYGLRQFVVDGDGESMPLSNRHNMFKETFDDSSIILISFILIGMVAFCIYFIYRKRRVN